MRQRRDWILLLVVAFAGASLSAQDPGPAGEQFQINTYTTSFQLWPAVAAAPMGDFVVVWESYGSYGTDTSSSGVQGQRYDATGEPVAGQFQVNTYTTDQQSAPSVAVEGDGDFVVVWTSYGSYGTDTDILSVQGQRYDAAGAVVGGEFQANTYTTGPQMGASVAVDTDGDFVVVWTSYGSYGTDTFSSSVQGQLYDATGAPVGSEFQVNTYTTGQQMAPSVAVDAAGDFVVVWTSYGSYGTDTSGSSVQGQRYDATGAPVGGEFQVNTYTTDQQYAPSVAVEGDGAFVVVWSSEGSYGTDSYESSIQGQHYDAAGNPVGGEFQVNTYTTEQQNAPSVAVDANGDFVVAWHSNGSYGTDSDRGSIQGQHYDAAGNPIGGEFQINTYTTDQQSAPSVAVEASGDFVVVWTSGGSSGTDTSYSSIQGQRFQIAIFTDGFESGDTSAWSGSVP